MAIHSGACSRRRWAMPAISFVFQRVHGIRISSVSNVAFDASSERIRPDAQFRFGRVSTLLRQSLRNVSHGLGVGSPLRETNPPIHGIHRQRVKRGHHRVNSIAELLPRDDMCARCVRNSGKRFALAAG